jgi:hypothetical protein
MTYRTVHTLPVGTPIYLYGWRKVVDVHNLSKKEGGPQKVKLVTGDGTFIFDRNTLLETES